MRFKILDTIKRQFGKCTTCFGWAAAMLLVFGSSVQAQNLLWAKRAGSGGAPSIPNDLGQAIAVDVFGNSYVTGQFRNTATFGPNEINQTVLTTAGASQEIFVAKYNSSGVLQWAKRISTVEGQGLGIGLDAAGNSYVTGFFNSAATFAPGEINETPLAAAGVKEVFLAKYDINGNFVWAKRAGGIFSDQAEGIAVDALGNSYITGRFGDVARFGSGELNQTDLTASGLAEDIFVAKYNSSGLLQWAKRAGGTGTDQGLAIAIDATGNSYVTGIFNGSAMFPATFGSGEANQTDLVATNFNSDLFVAKYNGNGSLQWVKRAGGVENDRGVAIAVDGAGNPHVTGTIRSRAFFAPGEANETFIDASGLSEEAFVAKYNTSGALVWVIAAGQGFGEAIALDPFGNSYITGTMGVFAAKYNASGISVWSTTFAGGAGIAKGFGIGLDGFGSVYVTGQYNNTVIFGQGEFNQTSLTSAGANDVFVAKFAGGSILVFCPDDSLQNAINLAAPGQSIAVSGTCIENILVRNEKQRISIDGSNTAVIDAPSNNTPAINIRGKGILIQGVTISGGSNGVYVNRGSNAVLNNNVIQNSMGNGIQVDELAFSVITNNTIQNNDRAGIFVTEASTARIGFNADSEMSASPNTIQSNASGIVVSNGSSARIIGNTIQNNAGSGIQVVRDAQADVASNALNGNGVDGIEAGENSLVQLGEASGTSIYESPNESINANAGFAVRCSNGGVAGGRLGTLNGLAGLKSFSDGTCIDSLN